MPTAVEPTVDTGGTGDYDSLNAAEAANFGATGVDLVSNDENVVCACQCTDGNADTTAVTIDGFTTDATRDIEVTVDSDYRHSGVYPTSGNVYRIQVSSDAAIDSNSANVQLFYIAGGVSDQAGTYDYVFDLGGEDSVCEGCVATLLGSPADKSIGIITRDSTTIRNCIVYGFTGSSLGYGIRCQTAGAVAIDNCTVFGCLIGVTQVAGATVTVKNSITFGNNADYVGTFDASSDYNATDGSGTGQGSNNVDLSGYTAAEIFQDPTNDDYHLTFGSPCYGVGADLSVTFTTDIDGETRSRWDIGADEYNPARQALGSGVTIMLEDTLRPRAIADCDTSDVWIPGAGDIVSGPWATGEQIRGKACIRIDVRDNQHFAVTAIHCVMGLDLNSFNWLSCWLQAHTLATFGGVDLFFRQHGSTRYQQLELPPPMPGLGDYETSRFHGGWDYKIWDISGIDRGNVEYIAFRFHYQPGYRGRYFLIDDVRAFVEEREAIEYARVPSDPLHTLRAVYPGSPR